TSMEKIRLVDRNGNHGEELARRLRYLTQVTARRDEVALLRALTALAPEYRPDLPTTRHAVSLASHYNGYGNGNGHGNGHRPTNGHAHTNGRPYPNGHAHAN